MKKKIKPVNPKKITKVVGTFPSTKKLIKKNEQIRRLLD